VASPEFRQSRDWGRPGTGDERWGAHLGSIWGRSWGWGGSSDGVRWRQVAAAAGAPSLGKEKGGTAGSSRG
jgi:hypothetical protein